VEMLERGITCLVIGAVAMLLLEALICCPGCFPESHPLVLNLGAGLIRHSLSVVRSVGRAQLRLCL